MNSLLVSVWICLTIDHSSNVSTWDTCNILFSVTGKVLLLVCLHSCSFGRQCTIHPHRPRTYIETEMKWNEREKNSLLCHCSTHVNISFVKAAAWFQRWHCQRNNINPFVHRHNHIPLNNWNAMPFYTIAVGMWP